MTRSSPTPPSPAGRASLRLLALFALLGPTLFVACSDDGNLLGSDGGAGQSMAGTSNSAGNGNAGKASGGSGAQAGSGGAVSSAGQGGSSGTATNGGQAGSGGANCQTGQCIRANVCLDHCGGTVVYSGCCACPAATVEELSCATGGAGQGGSGGATGGDCLGETCSADQTCVGYRVIGGAFFPPDQDGQCMAGRHLEGNNCENDFNYGCAALTGCGAPGPTCRCAVGSPCYGTTICKLPTESVWLDAAAELVCELQAP